MSRRPTGQCRLCLQERSLCRSHIIPDFMYRYFDDEKGEPRQYLFVPGDPGQRIRRAQTGIWEHMLCQLCEEQLNRYETYAKRLLDTEDLPIDVLSATDDYGVIAGVDYSMLKIFQISLLWRAGVATHGFFEHVALGDHEETLRQMISGENPGPAHQYRCFMSAIIDGKSRELLDLIHTPETLDIDGLLHVRFVVGGFLWLFVLSDEPSKEDVPQMYLQENGQLFFLKSDVRQLSFIMRSIPAMRARYRDVMALLTKKRQREPEARKRGPGQ